MNAAQPDITPEELDKFQTSFKDEKFRKLFYEYLDELKVLEFDLGNMS
jgi:hypothetical protein